MNLRTIQHDRVDSTQARAWAAVQDGSACSGDVHVALAQDEGRGRRGTKWHSPQGPGLYLSAIVLLPGPTVAPGCWTAAGALALVDVAVPAGAMDVRLKWPNDLVDAAGAKLAGVLAEARPGPKGGTTVVLGLGLNVGPMEFPADLVAERPVTDLAQLGSTKTWEGLLEAVLASLSVRLQQAAERAPSLSADFRGALALGEGPLRVETPQGQRTGRLVDLDLHGDLELATDQGRWQVPIEHVSGLVRGVE